MSTGGAIVALYLQIRNIQFVFHYQVSRFNPFADAILAVVLAFVPVWDRISLDFHSSRLKDSSAPLHERFTASTKAADTFFFRKTAAKALQKVAGDESAFPRLRRQCNYLSRYLEALSLSVLSEANRYNFTSESNCYIESLGSNISLCVIEDSVSGPQWLLFEMSESISDFHFPSLRDHDFLLASLLMQKIEHQRIIMLDDDLEVQVIGTESDFKEAMKAIERRAFPESKVFHRVILPFIKRLDSPGTNAS